MSHWKNFAAILLTSTAMAVAAPALAQAAADAEQNDGGIAEIVVTAQKRAESAQDVPIAISVFSGDALSERAVNNVSQLTAVAPNVNFDNGVAFTGSTAVLAASIRGIGSSDFAFNIDPGVGALHHSIGPPDRTVCHQDRGRQRHDPAEPAAMECAERKGHCPGAL